MRALIRAPRIGFAGRSTWNCDEVHQLAHRENEATRRNEYVPLAIVRDVLTHCDGSSVNTHAILRDAGLSQDRIEQEERISYSDFARFWRAFTDETGDEFFFQDQRGMPAGSFTLMCHAALQSPTLGTAMRRMLRFFSVMLHDFHAELLVEGDSAHIVVRETGGRRSSLAYGTWLSMLLGVSSWLVDQRVQFDRVDFRSPANGAEEHYQRLFCADMHFDASETRIVFPAAILSREPARNEQQLKAFLKACPETLLTQYQSRDSLSAQIHEELRYLPPDAWPSFDELASTLLTTASTLRRRLASENSSYQRIKDAIRCERAITELTEGDKLIVEIAEGLGFSDPSTFYRAFKKWTGGTPNLYRAPSAPMGATVYTLHAGKARAANCR
ncbi:hypothetical protein BH10PSE12_BH10PSE12_22770 [soil metagenome]